MNDFNGHMLSVPLVFPTYLEEITTIGSHSIFLSLTQIAAKRQKRNTGIQSFQY